MSDKRTNYTSKQAVLNGESFYAEHFDIWPFCLAKWHHNTIKNHLEISNYAFMLCYTLFRYYCWRITPLVSLVYSAHHHTLCGRDQERAQCHSICLGSQSLAGQWRRTRDDHHYLSCGAAGFALPLYSLGPGFRFLNHYILPWRWPLSDLGLTTWA